MGCDGYGRTVAGKQRADCADLYDSYSCAARYLRCYRWSKPAFYSYPCDVSTAHGALQRTPEACCLARCFYHCQRFCAAHPGWRCSRTCLYLAVAVPGDYPPIALPRTQ